jgi:hypothetical protein
MQDQRPAATAILSGFLFRTRFVLLLALGGTVMLAGGAAGDESAWESPPLLAGIRGERTGVRAGGHDTGAPAIP